MQIREHVASGKPAVILAGKVTSFAELEERANRLAHFWRALQVPAVALVRSAIAAHGLWQALQAATRRQVFADGVILTPGAMANYGAQRYSRGTLSAARSWARGRTRGFAVATLRR